MFKQGDELKKIYFQNEEFAEIGVTCDNIVVSMECGQMSGVPWFEVWRDGKLKTKWNGALVEGVEYKDD